MIPSTVKLIRAGDKALWFGRGMTGYGDWHLGVYGYRTMHWLCIRTWKKQEERVEKLEQLRWLKAGWTIGCTRVDFNGIEINTEKDRSFIKIEVRKRLCLSVRKINEWALSFVKQFPLILT